MNIRHNIFSISVYSITTIAITLMIAGCGKHESAGGVMGGATGAVIGASVAGKNSRGTGALIGGLIGHVIGTTAGRSADDEERAAQQERLDRARARREAASNHELARMRAENDMLKNKWCADCGKQTTLIGAHSCAACGGMLIHERFCRECTATFSPKTGYRYCPYCRSGVKLSSR